MWYSIKRSNKSRCSENYERTLSNRYGKTQYSKLITDIPEVDVAISMGCDVKCPYIGRNFDESWGLVDPTGHDDEFFKNIIKEIENHVINLNYK